MPASLYEKLWNSHLVREEGSQSLLYIDRHLVHEVTSPQAYEGLRMANRKPWRAKSVVATADHNTPTMNWQQPISDEMSRVQVDTLNENIQSFGAKIYFPFRHERQGIVHVVGPEMGATLPGMTVVCGDSHTSTHGALGCLAFGIGTSEVEHVLATQCLVQAKSPVSRLWITGTLKPGVFAKDVILYFISHFGTAWGNNQAVEYAGPTVRALSMEGRMTICNMSIEAGARAGMVAVDDTTVNYVAGRPLAPKNEDWDRAVAFWHTLKSDEGATFNREITLEVGDLEPQVSWGTSPEMVVSVTGVVPDPSMQPDAQRRASMERALLYMDLQPNTRMTDIVFDRVFIGSCTNARIEDLRVAAHVLRGKKKAANLRQVLVVPGSGLVKRQAEAEGLHQIFLEAGCEWREPGCSMCLGMNEDRLLPGERCASTSNRNFEGRQGPGGRTHLMSPAMAAAAVIYGRVSDVRTLTFS